ncbi:MAG: VOC family protein [Ilumatobacteraceae bacterium]|nr:VOC family protein [Ilumatobacteraceae bacterium]
MSVPARLSLVALGVTDVARATSFYEALGWQRSSASNDDISFFQLGGSGLAVFGRQALADDATVSSTGEGFAGVSLAINLESEAEVDRVAAEWLTCGGTLVKQPHRVFWGGYSGYVADLDGHLWELAFNPGFPLLADGSIQLPTAH